MKKEFVYCGQINTNTTPWRFNVDEIPVVDDGILGLKADAPYFQSRNYSSEHFDGRIFDKPLKITDEMTLFYSRDEKKCAKFLEDEYYKMIKTAKLAVQNLENAVFITKDGEDRRSIALCLAEEIDEEISGAKENGMER